MELELLLKVRIFRSNTSINVIRKLTTKPAANTRFASVGLNEVIALNNAIKHSEVNETFVPLIPPERQAANH
jgi:hypothetical protein